MKILAISKVLIAIEYSESFFSALPVKISPRIASLLKQLKIIFIISKGVCLEGLHLVGYAIILFYGAACFILAPAALGPWTGLLIGLFYFLFMWFLGGLYLSSVIHLGIAHRSLDYKDWFLKLITLFYNTFGIYINPVAWVNRHRLHHKFADHPGDPNKLESDGFWRTMYRCLMPYKCETNMATDEIFKSWTFRLVDNWGFAVLSQIFNFSLLWFLVSDLYFATAMWVGFRAFALWVNMIQNYWTHDRRYGYRRYNDERDNAMNIGEWLPVMASFSACLQNNHHHFPSLLRLSHTDEEFDFGFMTVKAMKSLGLVQATARGTELPPEIPLTQVGF